QSIEVIDFIAGGWVEDGHRIGSIPANPLVMDIEISTLQCDRAAHAKDRDRCVRLEAPDISVQHLAMSLAVMLIEDDETLENIAGIGGRPEIGMVTAAIAPQRFLLGTIALRCPCCGGNLFCPQVTLLDLAERCEQHLFGHAEELGDASQVMRG